MRQVTVLLMAVVLLMAGCSSGTTDTTTVAAVEANEIAYYEAWMAKDLDALMDTMTEDVIWVDETYGDYMEGQDAVRSMYSFVIEFTDPDGTGVLELFVSEDGTPAASTWEWTGTNAYGKTFDLPTTLIHEYRDGKISKQTAYYASPDAYDQLMGSQADR